MPRTEAGIGALMPWAERLWFTTYPAHGPQTGTRTGLFSIDDDFQVTVHEGVGTGTYANRMIHDDTDTLVMGPHLISTEGEIRVIDDQLSVSEVPPAQSSTNACAASADGTPGGRGPV